MRFYCYLLGYINVPDIAGDKIMQSFARNEHFCYPRASVYDSRAALAGKQCKFGT